MAFTSIDDPSAYFQTLLYTGNASARSLTNDGNSNLQPDWVWTKKRNEAQNHCVTDSTRGVGNILFPDVNDAESATQLLTSFDSDGFSINNNALVNDNSDTYVAWQWKANGGTTTTNDASATSVGSIDSVYQANTDAGFSIVTYTGTGSSATVAHGLGAVPHFIIVKKRNTADNWYVYHHENTSAPATDYLVLDTTDGTTDDTVFGDATPTSTVFSINNAGTHASGKTFVAYCFTEKQGYSRFGHYTGNGNADGPFIYTGFKPAWILFKATAGTENWGIFDNKRNTQTGNPRDIYLMPSANNADSSESDSVDFLSNGFKWRISSGFRNGDGVNFIYMAFAESPFVSSSGVPTTAR